MYVGSILLKHVGSTIRDESSWSSINLSKFGLSSHVRITQSQLPWVGRWNVKIFLISDVNVISLRDGGL